MRLMKYIGVASMVGTLSLALVGSASAADVNVDTTGPDSTQTTTIKNTTSVDTTNTNKVDVANVNLQEAATGDVKADKNTTVGSLTSAAASNENAANTTVKVSNEAPVPGQGSEGSGSGNQGTGGAGSGNPPASNTGGMGSGVLGASTTPGMGAGEAMLPEVGASVPVDVSALRAGWPPRTEAAKALARNSNVWSAAMLGIASVLSLVGAALSYAYSRRKERRVV